MLITHPGKFQCSLHVCVSIPAWSRGEVDWQWSHPAEVTDLLCKVMTKPLHIWCSISSQVLVILYVWDNMIGLKNNLPLLTVHRVHRPRLLPIHSLTSFAQQLSKSLKCTLLVLLHCSHYSRYCSVYGDYGTFGASFTIGEKNGERRKKVIFQIGVFTSYGNICSSYINTPHSAAKWNSHAPGPEAPGKSPGLKTSTGLTLVIVIMQATGHRNGI